MNGILWHFCAHRLNWARRSWELSEDGEITLLMQMLTLYVLCMCNNCIKFKVIGYVYNNNIIRISTVNNDGAFRKWGTVLSYNPFRAGTDFLFWFGPRTEIINIFVISLAKAIVALAKAVVALAKAVVALAKAVVTYGYNGRRRLI